MGAYKVLVLNCQKMLEINCHFLLESTCRLHEEILTLVITQKQHPSGALGLLLKTQEQKCIHLLNNLEKE